MDASEAFLSANRRYNAERENIFYVQLHSRVDGLRSLRLRLKKADLSVYTTSEARTRRGMLPGRTSCYC